MEAIHKGAFTALTHAYQAVSQLGYTHRSIKTFEPSVTYPTLRRIRDGKAGKFTADYYYLQVFVRIIKKEYDVSMSNGGDNSRYLLTVLKNILFEMLEIIQ